MKINVFTTQREQQHKIMSFLLSVNNFQFEIQDFKFIKKYFNEKNIIFFHPQISKNNFKNTIKLLNNCSLKTTFLIIPRLYKDDT